MPREMKDGPMACPKAQIQTYPATLKGLRISCLEILAEHEASTPDTLWQETDGPGDIPSTESGKALLKLATEVSTAKGRPVFPPKNTRLSDELVYLATKHLGAKERGYYVLCGRSHATWVGWHLRPRFHRQMLSWPVWTIGPVVAPGSALKEHRCIERQARVWKMKSAKDAEWGREKNGIARDVVSFAHADGSVVPKDSKGGFFVTQLFRVHGYSVRVGPDYGDTKKANVQVRGFFSKNRAHDFDYEACLKRPYQNWRKPMIYGDHVESEGVDSDGDTAMDEQRQEDFQEQDQENSVTDADQENSRYSDEKTDADSVESGEIIEHANGHVDTACDIVQNDASSPVVEKDQIDSIEESRVVSQNEVQQDIQKEIGV
ncbi:hypothetical protein N7478_003435 [Penicillium angulare]|uniref:uncharacterized protein n=1 Tax=Penicillium angulare TaxID=116970 RepID=UPI0025415405|nr:uncharacterized protein N7478_003435 [Penicillium angulare]KAJ5287749.1 hypothetical protein N7478_003435 [Penicillium angulare]